MSSVFFFFFFFSKVEGEQSQHERKKEETKRGLKRPAAAAAVVREHANARDKSKEQGAPTLPLDVEEAVAVEAEGESPASG